ncbi:hypothetical protein WMO40_20175 [Bacillaceae bacterium CLA-AA-H227]|uniref:Uncharacterized protein n=1 Tax=Robertmurraya yapensis (ex Hitch et al 2024) TaxID=3133160 RepID=A0ACC6SG42_9BACI
MAVAIAKNPEWMVKLSATSIGITVAVAKLVNYQRELAVEKQKDKSFYNDLRQAFIDCSEVDKEFSEKLSIISKESDSLVVGDDFRA